MLNRPGAALHRTVPGRGALPGNPCWLPQEGACSRSSWPGRYDVLHIHTPARKLWRRPAWRCPPPCVRGVAMLAQAMSAQATLAQTSIQTGRRKSHLVGRQRSAASLCPKYRRNNGHCSVCPHTQPLSTPCALVCNWDGNAIALELGSRAGVTGGASAAMCAACNEHVLASAVLTIAKCVGKFTRSTAVCKSVLGAKCRRGTVGRCRRSAMWKRPRMAMDSRTRAGC